MINKTFTFIFGLPVTVALLLIRFYQIVLSPLKAGIFGPGAGCRFYPSCSEYGVEAIRQHGLLLGGGRTLWRVLKCHPLHPGGFDPVPPRHVCGNVGSAPDDSSGGMGAAGLGEYYKARDVRRHTGNFKRRQV